MDINSGAEATSAAIHRGGTAYGLAIAVAAAVGGLLFGYDTAVISGAILFVRELFHLSAFQTELRSARSCWEPPWVLPWPVTLQTVSAADPCCWWTPLSLDCLQC
jgi:hypothetical protein